MRYTTAALVALAGLSMATPVQKRQDIDFAAYEAIPIVPDVAAPLGDVAPAAATYVASEVASAAAAAATDPSTGADAAVTITKRHEKRAPCGPNTPGTTTAVNNPDTDTAFQNFLPFNQAASNARTPPGYNLVAQGARASAQDSTYMTYKMMSSYDPSACAAYCQQKQGCNSFNLYFERDPTNDVGATCPQNPASLTYIKCAIYGGILNSASAKNNGGWQGQFHVVITGSNIYTATAPATPDGFTGPVSYGNAAINAPSSYITVQTFPQTQPYDPSVCAAACDANTAYNAAHPPATGSPDVCNFFVAYYLYKNGQNGVFTCSYYTSSWDSSYATNRGQTNQWNDKFTIGYSNGFAKPGAPVNGVAPQAAVAEP